MCAQRIVASKERIKFVHNKMTLVHDEQNVHIIRQSRRSMHNGGFTTRHADELSHDIHVVSYRFITCNLIFH